MKIGIIGSGISGLTAAFEFGKRGYEVSLFEQQNCVGMAALVVHIGDLQDSKLIIDVPSRLLNADHWPGLLRLYREAGIETTPVRPTQTYSDFNRQPYLQLDPQKLFSVGSSLNSFAMFSELAMELKRLRDSANRDLQKGIAESVTFDQYLSELRISNRVKLGFLYPLLSSTVCTCSYQSITKYPANLVLGILNDLNQSKPGDLPLLRTLNGTSDVVHKLLCYEPKLLLGRRVEAVATTDQFAELTCRELHSPANDVVERHQFDHIVVATQANHAARMLSESFAHETDALKQFKYEDVEVVVHTDEALLPANQKTMVYF